MLPRNITEKFTEILKTHSQGATIPKNFDDIQLITDRLDYNQDNKRQLEILSISRTIFDPNLPASIALKALEQKINHLKASCTSYFKPKLQQELANANQSILLSLQAEYGKIKNWANHTNSSYSRYAYFRVKKDQIYAQKIYSHLLMPSTPPDFAPTSNPSPEELSVIQDQERDTQLKFLTNSRYDDLTLLEAEILRIQILIDLQKAATVHENEFYSQEADVFKAQVEAIQKSSPGIKKSKLDDLLTQEAERIRGEAIKEHLKERDTLDLGKLQLQLEYNQLLDKHNELKSEVVIFKTRNKDLENKIAKLEAAVLNRSKKTQWKTIHSQGSVTGAIQQANVESQENAGVPQKNSV